MVDFTDAHQRHWTDAELLYGRQRWANADHLYGMSAECGLKAVMVPLGLSTDEEGSPSDKKELELDLFSFALNDDGAPHDPMPIYWNEGLQALPSLRELPRAAVDLAYKRFFDRFDVLMESMAGGSQ